MHPLLHFCWIVFQIVIGYNLVLPLILYLVYLVSKSPSLQRNNPSNKPADYAIIITAYEQLDTVPAAVASILKLAYSNYMVYIVADKCDISSLAFTDERIVVLRPPETLASNTRSHFYAINHFLRPHERLTIVDSDNLVHPEYLNELNVYFDAGYEAVQGTRNAKNLNTTYACLDAARDIYYHFYDGKILFQAGSSATLAGSGMAFTTVLYKNSLAHLDITGAGFDKVLQHQIVSKKKRIAFAEKAIVYDEKTSRSDQLVKQRARWINTWFKYFSLGFGLIANGIASLDRNRFLFGFILLRPPLFIFLILSFFCMLANLWVSVGTAFLWLLGFVVFIGGFAFALYHSKTDKKIYTSLVNIPAFMFYQVLSLLKVGRANKVSVATQHYHHTNINDI